MINAPASSKVISQQNGYSKEYVDAYAFLQWIKYVFGNQIYAKYGVPYNIILQNVLKSYQLRKKWSPIEKFLSSVQHFKKLYDIYKNNSSDFAALAKHVPQSVRKTKWYQSLLGKVLNNIQILDQFVESYDPYNPPKPVESQAWFESYATLIWNVTTEIPSNNQINHLLNEAFKPPLPEDAVWWTCQLRDQNWDIHNVSGLRFIQDGNYYEWINDEWDVVTIPLENI
jgi:hypothetical protein